MEPNPLFKLTTRQAADNEVEIRLEGRLEEGALGDVRGLLERSSGKVTLDLSGLAGVDTESRRFLAGLRGRGCRLVGGSLYIKRLLEEA